MAQVDPDYFICTANDFHPYACDGPGRCIHCDRKTLPNHKVSLCGWCIEDVNAQRRSDRAVARILSMPEESHD